MPDAVVDVPAAFVLVPVGLLLLLAGLGRRPRSRRRVAWVVAATPYAVAVLYVTLFPMTLRLGDTGNQAAWSTQVSLIPFATFSARTFVLNILLFVPLGALLVLSPAPVGLRTAGVVSLACSGLLEAIQLGLTIAASTGRSADVDDLLANSLGGAVGFVCVRALVVIALPRQGRARRRPAHELCSEPA